MRACVLILTLIGVAVAVGAAIDPGPAIPPPPYEKVWVRTVDGWEPLISLQNETRRESSRLHPFAVAGFQIFGSLLALVAFERASRHR